MTIYIYTTRKPCIFYLHTLICKILGTSRICKRREVYSITHTHTHISSWSADLCIGVWALICTKLLQHDARCFVPSTKKLQCSQS